MDGTLILNRNIDLLLVDIKVIIKDTVLRIKNNETKVLQLPEGEYTLLVSDGFFCSTTKRITIREDQDKLIDIKPIIPTIFLLFSIGLILALFVLTMISLIPAIIFSLVNFIVVMFVLLTTLLKRNKYFILKEYHD